MAVRMSIYVYVRVSIWRIQHMNGDEEGIDYWEWNSMADNAFKLQSLMFLK